MEHWLPLTKLKQQFKPTFYKFLMHESVEVIQQRLQLVFERTFGQVMWDIRYNIDGHFIDRSKTTFKIRQTGGINTGGANFYFLGQLVSVDKSTTEIILTPNRSIVFPFWLFLLLWACVFCYAVITSAKPFDLETVLVAAILLTMIFVSSKWKSDPFSSVVKDLKKALKNEE